MNEVVRDIKSVDSACQNCHEAGLRGHTGKGACFRMLSIMGRCAIRLYYSITQRRNIHYCDVMMDTKASQITSLAIVYSTVYSDADKRRHQSSVSLAFVWGIHRWPVNSPHKWQLTRKMFPFDFVIMLKYSNKIWKHQSAEILSAVSIEYRKHLFRYSHTSFFITVKVLFQTNHKIKLEVHSLCNAMTLWDIANQMDVVLFIAEHVLITMPLEVIRSHELMNIAIW